MFTQRDEEKHILKFFKDKMGRFLDIGAANGECFSTTRALALLGWGGICVEPSPTVLPALRKIYAENSKVSVLEIAISNVSGKVEFYDSGGDMISTVSKVHRELWKQKVGVEYTTLMVDSLTVPDLFCLIGYDFEFISLDVEGTNLEIFSRFPFGKLTQTKMLCVEFDYQEGKILELVRPYGFILLHKTAENLLLGRK